MAGVWMHPIKLVDGFWFGLEHNDCLTWLKSARVFRNYSFHNEFEYEQSCFTVVRKQFVPLHQKGVIVTYTIMNNSNIEQTVTPHFSFKTELRPVWLAEEIGITDAEDELTWENDMFLGKDSVSPWYVAIQSDQKCVNHHKVESNKAHIQTVGQGKMGHMELKALRIPANSEYDVTFYIAGSVEKKEDVQKTLEKLKMNQMAYWQEKKVYYESVLNDSKITIPDVELQTCYDWVKIHGEWLTLDVDGVGKGLAAGIPEYAWWFGCDNSYALSGYLRSGKFELAKQTLSLIRDVSERENGNGRVVHEIQTQGVVSNKGNIQETPHFVKIVWETFLWTGDVAWLREMYPFIQKGMEWVMSETTGENMFPKGYGIIEVLGLNGKLIDTAVYTYEAFTALSEMAKVVGNETESALYFSLAEKVKQQIQDLFWLEDEGMYGDMRMDTATLKVKIEDILSQYEGNKESKIYQYFKNMSTTLTDSTKEETFLFKNWVVNVPLEAKLATEEQASRMFERLESDEFTGTEGVYLSGYEQKHMMTISTAVQAVAEGKYRRTEEMLRYVKLIVSTLHRYLPGSICEMSPDYGCFVQAWTSYGVIQPIVSAVFGISPHAFEKKITIQPQLPLHWEYAEIENVKVGENYIHVKLYRKDNQVEVNVHSLDDSWDIEVIKNETR